MAAATMIILFGAVPSHASCDFKTGESMGKLDAYEAISAMSIKTPNYTRWLEEVLNILISDSHTLNQSQKNWHRAKIDVEYKYGNCTHSAKIKLHGDLRDHLKYDGEVKSSLRVKMQDGNIGSAVGFKLFLPQTRNGINEILATMALRELGVLAPDTFFVDVKFNQLKVRYLFQEDISKEFLERNSRREGPIFEGDERFLWNSSGFDIQNQKHSLGRLTNER